MMRMPFESKEALQLNNEIFETIYFAAMTASCDLSKKYGTYETYEGSPLSQGLMQFDLWGVEPESIKTGSQRWDWQDLKKKVAKHGVRNSLLVAPMPTASTSQILGNNECFEPITSNIYVRRVLSGEFAVVNKYLVADLMDQGLWTEEIRNQIIANNGSVQNINSIPEDLKKLYKTVWEIKQRAVIDMAGRGPYICQSQSMNVHVQEPNFGKLSSMHFYAWKAGLKTGMYYLRTRAAVNAVKFQSTTLLKRLKKQQSKKEKRWSAQLITQKTVSLADHK